MDLRASKQDLIKGRDYTFLALYSDLNLFCFNQDQVILAVDVIVEKYYGGRENELLPTIQKFKKEKGCETITKNLFVINKDKIKVDSKYIVVDRDNFYRIMNSLYRWDRKLNLLYHYCCVIASLNYGDDTMIDGRRGIYGYMSNAFFSRIENVDVRSITTYNNTLEELKLIARIKKRWSEKQNRLMPSIYALKENEKLLVKIYDNINPGIEKPDEEGLEDLFD